MTTAAGRYQFTGQTWDEIKIRLGLPDFSPSSQDRAAWWMAQQQYAAASGRDLSADLAAPERREEALRALRGLWPSLDEDALAVFEANLAKRTDG